MQVRVCVSVWSNRQFTEQSTNKNSEVAPAHFLMFFQPWLFCDAVKKAKALLRTFCAIKDYHNLFFSQKVFSEWCQTFCKTQLCKSPLSHGDMRPHVKTPILLINPLTFCGVLKCNFLLLNGDSLKPVISTWPRESSSNKIIFIWKFLWWAYGLLIWDHHWTFFVFSEVTLARGEFWSWSTFPGLHVGDKCGSFSASACSCCPSSCLNCLAWHWSAPLLPSLYSCFRHSLSALWCQLLTGFFFFFFSM